ncbi:tetratricopeptide repeat protein [Maritimibacter dapengensis]|uniref:Sel1 repeat family protein n=1 Tax=Maritimibacter dapengensis TaxID=2836868 RepID=A0ABS6T1A9_9RHOB|nr:tetratricopeptide repeat protein [Maritimibacter dapengensis]MBV7378513.1 sel1 repeat family protein [Maritimibacter dapengensis]
MIFKTHLKAGRSFRSLLRAFAFTKNTLQTKRSQRCPTAMCLILAACSIAIANPAKSESAFDRGYALLLKGTPDDVARATHELVAASNEGDLRATFIIGTLLQYGVAYERNEAAALKYYLHAADRGLPAAALAASDLFYFPKQNKSLTDNERAFHYAKQAAAAGSSDAMTHLANLYWRGTGVEESQSEAVRLLHTAMELGHADAGTWLGRLYREGTISTDGFDQIVRKITPLAESGDPAAQVSLARIVHSGWNGEPNREVGENLFRRAADAGNSQGQFTMCRFARRDGQASAAYKWCSLAAQQDHVGAMNLLSFAHLKGDAAPRDTSAALHLAWSAAIMGSREGQRLVKRVYDEIAKQKVLAAEAARREKNREAILRFIGWALTPPPPEKDPYLSRQWDQFQQDQQRLQRQVNELSAIAWSGL